MKTFQNLKSILYLFLLLRGSYQDDESRPYEFGFTIEGEQHRYEKKDVNGIIQGEFGFITADGVYHVTMYATDENGSFRILSTRNIRLSGPLDQPTQGQQQQFKNVNSPSVTYGEEIAAAAPPGAFNSSPRSGKQLDVSSETNIQGVTSTEPSANLPVDRLVSTPSFLITPLPTVGHGCSNCGIVSPTQTSSQKASISQTSEPPSSAQEFVVSDIPSTATPEIHRIGKEFSLTTSTKSFSLTPVPTVAQGCSNCGIPSSDFSSGLRDYGKVVQYPSTDDSQSGIPSNDVPGDSGLGLPEEPNIDRSGFSRELHSPQIRLSTSSAQFSITPIPTVAHGCSNCGIPADSGLKYSNGANTQPETSLDEDIGLNIVPQNSELGLSEGISIDRSNFSRDLSPAEPSVLNLPENKLTTSAVPYSITPVPTVGHGCSNCGIPADDNIISSAGNGAVPTGKDNRKPKQLEGTTDFSGPPGLDVFNNSPLIDRLRGVKQKGENIPGPRKDIYVADGKVIIPGSKSIEIKDKYPGMVDGLPKGITDGDILDLLYKFNYTFSFHGHYERGFRNGAKIGGYFVNGRDGISRIVTYIADENGYRSKFQLVNLGLDSPDTPKEATEKSFGLKSFEFIWYPVE